jgi:hypothetical protein
MQNFLYSSHYPAIRSSLNVRGSDGEFRNGRSFRTEFRKESELGKQFKKRSKTFLIASTITLVITALLLVGFITIIVVNELATTPKESVTSSLVTISVTETNDSKFNTKTTYIIWPLVIAVLGLSVLLQVIFSFWKCTGTKIGCMNYMSYRSVEGEDKYNNRASVEKDGGDEQLAEILYLSTDRYQWISNALCLSLVYWITASVAGVSDLYLLITIFGLGVWVNLGAGLFHEWSNASLLVLVFFPSSSSHHHDASAVVRKNTNWWYFITAVVPFAIYWAIVLVHLVLRLCPSAGCLSGEALQPYWYVITWVVAMMVLSIGLLVTIIIQYNSITNEILSPGNGDKPSGDDVMDMNLNYALAKLVIISLMKWAPAILLIIVLYV